MKNFNEIIQKLNSVQYGCYNLKYKECIFQNDHRFNYLNFKQVKLLYPNKLLKYKCGTCYDTSLFIYSELLKLIPKENIKAIFYCIKDISHTTICFKFNNKWYNIEYSIPSLRGISKQFNTYIDLKHYLINEAETTFNDKIRIWNIVNYNEILNLDFLTYYDFQSYCF